MEVLEGAGAFDRLALFGSRADQARALGELREGQIPHSGHPSPVSQYLALSGRTLFQGMRFEDVHRLQLDVETTTLQPADPRRRVLLLGHHRQPGARGGAQPPRTRARRPSCGASRSACWPSTRT